GARVVDQRLGVAEQQVASGPEPLEEGLDRPALAAGVEVDDDVSTQDDVDRAEQRELRAVEEVQLDEVDLPLDLVVDAEAALAGTEVALAQGRLGLAEGGLAIHALARPAQDPLRDVRGVDAEVPPPPQPPLAPQHHD